MQGILEGTEQAICEALDAGDTLEDAIYGAVSLLTKEEQAALAFAVVNTDTGSPEGMFLVAAMQQALALRVEAALRREVLPFSSPAETARVQAILAGGSAPAR